MQYRDYQGRGRIRTNMLVLIYLVRIHKSTGNNRTLQSNQQKMMGEEIDCIVRDSYNTLSIVLYIHGKG